MTRGRSEKVGWGDSESVAITTSISPEICTCRTRLPNTCHSLYTGLPREKVQGSYAEEDLPSGASHLFHPYQGAVLQNPRTRLSFTTSCHQLRWTFETHCHPRSRADHISTWLYTTKFFLINQTTSTHYQASIRRSRRPT